MSPLKITIRGIDNGFMVESNHKSLYRYGSEVFDRARVEELFTKTLPEAVTLVREMADEYVRRKEEAEQSHKVDYSSVTRDRLKDVLGTIDSLTAQSGADVSLEALKSARRSSG